MAWISLGDAHRISRMGVQMHRVPSVPPSPCTLEGVDPLLAELQQPVALRLVQAGHPERPAVEQFIHTSFRRSYGADVQAFHPHLMAFSAGGRMRAAVGYRDGRRQPLFAEQYLDAPAEAVIRDVCGEPVERRQIVEVGNLALASPGQARWVIAAVTLYLHAAGYRWVLFTAVRPLVNAFQRLGLNPLVLAPADPARLGDAGRSWGSYYAGGPLVCAGDIAAGCRKLSGSVTSRQPWLRALLEQAREEASLAARLQRKPRVGAR